MKLTALDIPESTDALRGWLEQQIVGDQLGDLVAQLSMGPTGAPPANLGDIAGEKLHHLLQEGLASCNESDLAALLASPHLLLALQELVFTEGGEYWQQVPRTPEHLAAADRVRNKLLDSAAPGTSSTTQKPPARKRWVALAVAACLVIGAGVWLAQPPKPPAWGFDQAGLLEGEISPKDYFLQLSTAADQWFNQRPTNPRALKNRLTTFRDGCETLLTAPHRQLTEFDRKWLLDRCRKWRTKIDVLLQRIDQDDVPFDEARADADELIRKM